MSVRKAWDHIRRAKSDRTMCGLVWRPESNKGGAKRELCPTCNRRDKRGH